MKKTILIFFASLALLFLLSSVANAQLCDDRRAGPNGDKLGLIPCGNNVSYGPDGKTVTGVECPCELGHFFVMFDSIYGFIVKYIATSLATIMIVIGAIFMLISAGNPSLAGTGRKMIYSAIIGLVLIFGSWLIIDTILKIIGYSGSNSWFKLN